MRFRAASHRFRKSATHGSKEASIVNTWAFGGKNELIIAAQNTKGNTIHTKNSVGVHGTPRFRPRHARHTIAEPTWAGSSVRRPTPRFGGAFSFGNLVRLSSNLNR